MPITRLLWILRTCADRFEADAIIRKNNNSKNNNRKHA